LRARLSVSAALALERKLYCRGGEAFGQALSADFVARAVDGLAEQRALEPAEKQAAKELAESYVDYSRLDSNSLFAHMPLHPRALPAGFIAPCLPTSAPQPPSGEAWLHEIKHDGFRVIARKEGKQVKLYSRPGNDFTDRFPLIVKAPAGRRCRRDGPNRCRYWGCSGHGGTCRPARHRR
jgi:ATP-dependent DNA ligase